jgi:hypothetical protein
VNLEYGILGTWAPVAPPATIPAEISSPRKFSKQMVQIQNTKVHLIGINNYLYAARSDQAEFRAWIKYDIGAET